MEEGKRGKVHALQRILTRSLGAACWAVRRVTTNQGKRTPGVDGVVWSTPKAKQEAIAAIQRGPYQPLPLRRVYLPKPNGKKRPLGIPTVVSYCTSYNTVSESGDVWIRGEFRTHSLSSRSFSGLSVIQ